MARSEKNIIFGRVAKTGIEPVGPWDAEVLARYPIGAEVECRIFQPRSPPLARKFFAILGRVVDNTDVFPSASALANALLVHLGYFESVRQIGGGEHAFPLSIADMEKDEFERFFEAAIEVICTEIIPGLDRHALLEERRFVVR